MTRPDLDALQAQDVTGADYTSAASIAKVVAKLTDWQWLAEYANAGWNLPAAGTDALALLCGRAAAIIERLRAERDEARRECVEQARLLGMSGSREAALIAERDTLAAIVRAADEMHLKPTMDNINAWADARAKWEGKP